MMENASFELNTVRCFERKHAEHVKIIIRLACIHKNNRLCAPNKIKLIKKWNRTFSDLLCAESAFTEAAVVSVGNLACQ